jgi:divalent metal cation (Fe/Co/Zn/Cd) transporter
VLAAAAAGSVALLGFGIDSFVESASGGVLIWRLRAEQREPDRDVGHLERRAGRLVALSLAALAAYILTDATRTLWQQEKPEPSLPGIGLTIISMLVMWRLARAKRSAAAALDSRAMAADAFQTTACWWLSLSALLGVGLNSLLGWWWADPLAAVAMTGLLAREALEAWRGETCCDAC